MYDRSMERPRQQGTESLPIASDLPGSCLEMIVALAGVLITETQSQHPACVPYDL